jgi:predicted RNA-binding Zn ribbon-like protein
MPVSRNNEPSAPHDLDLVIAFVNTLDLETGIDQLATPPGLAAWLIDKQLLEPGASIQEAQRQQAIRLREAFRALISAHNGLKADPRAAGELERAGRQGQLSVHFAADGASRLVARAQGFAAALARILIPVVESDGDGSWQRVKACRAADCRWAFYDYSRNRSGVWCDMAVCGNRTKVRAYRRRKPGTVPL